VVISQVQTSNGQDYVDTRMEWIGSGEFRVAMEEEEASTTVHATETIGWVAFDAGSGTWNGRAYEFAFSEWWYTHVWATLDFTNTYTNPIFIGMETMNEGADPIHLRYANLDGDSIDLMVEEDQTADSEMNAAWQAVSYLVMDGPGDLTGAVYGAPTPTPTPNGSETVTPTPTMTPTPDGPVIGEAGSVSNVTSSGVTVALNHSYNNPVVIAQPGSYNDSDVALARVSDVTSSSFTVRMVEPAGGAHGGETVHYLVIESGSWELADGTHVEAGTINTNKTIGKNITNSWASISYPNAFTSEAVVISQVQTSNGRDYVDTRMKSIWATMFRVAMEEEEASTMVHATETIGWVAFDAGSGSWNGRAYEVAFSEWWYTHVWATLDFTNTYTNPIFIGMETMNEGADPIHLRYANLDGDSIDLMVEEDQTADSEMNAAWQAVSYLVIDGPCDLTGFVYGAVPATPTATASATTTATATETPVPGNTSTPTETATETPEPGDTSTATATATATNEATETETPTSEGTEAGRLHDDRGVFKLARPMLDDPATEPAESSGPITIDYTYDALNRLTDAVYSNGMAFHYSYDAAGNVLAYTRVVDGISNVITYTYDDANQLLTATEGETTWYYTYNSNGSLVMSSPSQGEANGATRNTYNTAGYLVKVEEHNGTAWQIQSEMRYDGLGNRLEMTSYNEGMGETIRYQLDNGQPLAAVGTESTSYYLYGRGVIGTKTDNWAYILQDGLGSTRQLVTHEGVIAMSVAYTPWGDVLEYYGSGGIDFGYLGGVYDENTGLIYLGGGQYYDPVTGRMLTRGAGSNPHKPGAFDPAGMMVAPLAMLGLVLGRKKKRGKWDTFIVLLVVCVVVGMSVSACARPASPTEEAETEPTTTATPIPTETSTEEDGTEIKIIATPTGTATISPTVALCVILSTTTPVPDTDDNIKENTNNDIPLTYRGAAMLKLVQDFNAFPGWWNNNIPNSMKFSTFVGIWILYEVGIIPAVEEFLIEAVKNQLWMDAPRDLARGAHCTEQSCNNGVYNFMAVQGGGHNLDRFGDPKNNQPPNALESGLETPASFLARAEKEGSYILAYDPERVEYNEKVPWNWGNDREKFKQVNSARKDWGYEEDQIVAAWEEDFVLFTIGQGNYYGWLRDDEDE
jgi:serralysin